MSTYEYTESTVPAFWDGRRPYGPGNPQPSPVSPLGFHAHAEFPPGPNVTSQRVTLSFNARPDWNGALAVSTNFSYSTRTPPEGFFTSVNFLQAVRVGSTRFQVVFDVSVIDRPAAVAFDPDHVLRVVDVSVGSDYEGDADGNLKTVAADGRTLSNYVYPFAEPPLANYGDLDVLVSRRAFVFTPDPPPPPPPPPGPGVPDPVPAYGVMTGRRGPRRVVFTR